MVRRKGVQALFTLLSALLFAGAAWVLYGELKKYGSHAILDSLRHLSTGELLLAALLTIACHWMLTFYDWLAFLYVGERLSYRRVTFAAFLAYTFGNNIGMANFAGAAIRYRIYSRWGIRATVVGQVIALDILSNWMGFFLTSGTVFLLFPPPLPPILHLPIETARPIGAVLFTFVTLYFAFGFFRERPLTVGKLTVRVPRNRIFLAQVAIGCLDFALGGLVLYALLPGKAPLPYMTFLGVYLLGQLASIISHVPGGLGVFETVVLTALAGRYEGPDVISSLLAYRVIYFFVPLVIALVLLVIFEIISRTPSGVPARTGETKSAHSP